MDVDELTRLLSLERFACILDADRTTHQGSGLLAIFAGRALYKQGWFGKAAERFAYAYRSTDRRIRLSATLYAALNETYRTHVDGHCLSACHTALADATFDPHLIPLCRLCALKATALGLASREKLDYPTISTLVVQHETVLHDATALRDTATSFDAIEALMALASLPYWPGVAERQQLIQRVTDSAIALKGTWWLPLLATPRARLDLTGVVDGDRIRERFVQVFGELDKAGVPLAAAHAEIGCAEALQAVGKPSAAYFESALHLYARQRHGTGMHRCYTTLAHMRAQLGDVKRAEAFSRKAYMLAGRMDYPHGRLTAASGLLHAASFANHHANAMKVIFDVMQLPLPPHAIASFEAHVGTLWDMTGVPSRALPYFRRASAAIRGSSSESHVLVLLAGSLERSGSIDEALATWCRACRADRVIGDDLARLQKILGFADCAITGFHNSANDATKRFRFQNRIVRSLQRAKRLVGSLATPGAEVLYLSTAARFCLVLDKISDATEHLSKAILLLGGDTPPVTRMYIITQLGLLHHRGWQLTRDPNTIGLSEPLIDEAIAIAEQLGFHSHTTQLRYISAVGWFQRGSHMLPLGQQEAWCRADTRLEEAWERWTLQVPADLADTTDGAMQNLALAASLSDLAECASRVYLAARPTGWRSKLAKWSLSTKAQEITRSRIWRQPAPTAVGQTQTPATASHVLGAITALRSTGQQLAVVDLVVREDCVLLISYCEDSEEPCVEEISVDLMGVRRLVEGTFGSSERVSRLFRLAPSLQLEPLSPIVSAIGRRVRSDQILVVSPDNLLAHVPLGSTQYEGEYLGMRNVSTTLPSLAMLGRIAARHPGQLGTAAQPATSRAVVIGDPTGDLPESRTEAFQVAEILGVTAIVGNAATVGQVTDMIRGADVVHYCGHAEFSPRDPFASGLRLADGLLTGAKMLSACAPAPSVFVLSACRTGKSSTFGHHSILSGLTQVLLAGGCWSVVASQWRVADVSTAELMVRFHDLRRSGHGVARSLRDASKYLASSWPSPYNWSPFSVFGDWR
ncbi:MAG: CHAT domain-containing protein [Tepidisphaeraceae bacterium]